MNCPDCGAENFDDAEFCTLCLAPLAEHPADPGRRAAPRISAQELAERETRSEPGVMSAAPVGRIGDDEVPHSLKHANIQGLLERLGDLDPAKRAHAAAALGEAGDTSAIGHLLQALKDADPAVARAAREALKEIGHRDEEALLQGRPDYLEPERVGGPRPWIVSAIAFVLVILIIYANRVMLHNLVSPYIP